MQTTQRPRLPRGLFFLMQFTPGSIPDKLAYNQFLGVLEMKWQLRNALVAAGFMPQRADTVEMLQEGQTEWGGLTVSSPNQVKGTRKLDPL